MRASTPARAIFYLGPVETTRHETRRLTRAKRQLKMSDSKPQRLRASGSGLPVRMAARLLHTTQKGTILWVHDGDAFGSGSPEGRPVDIDACGVNVACERRLPTARAV